MKNIIELRNQLCTIFDDVQSGKAKMSTAKELVNTAGKIIASLKAELDYAALRKEMPVIDFLGGDDAPKIRASNLLENKPEMRRVK